MLLVIDSQLFSNITYIRMLIEYKYSKIEKYDYFLKMSFRNRYVIAGANGLINLTVPVIGGREQKSLMKDVRIDNSEKWQIKHWRSLVSSYKKAPFFEFYENDVERLLWSKEEFLYFFNMNVLEWIFKILKIDLIVEPTEFYKKDYKDEFDYRNKFLPKSFQNESIVVPHYSQVFEARFGFQKNLSILDLIFCKGPNAASLLSDNKKQ